MTKNALRCATFSVRSLRATQTTLILVTHFRDDALDLAQRVLVLENGRSVVQDLLESVLGRPQHVAAVRSLGLGQILEGEINTDGHVVTTFGKVSMSDQVISGRVRLLVRPAQPRIVSNGDGVEAEVVAVEVRPTDAREVRRIAVVRVAGALLRVFVRDGSVLAGDRIRVRIDGECEPLSG